MQSEITVFGKPDDKQALAFQSAVQAQGAAVTLLPMQLAGPEQPRVCADPENPVWAGHSLADTKAVYIRGMARNTLPTIPPVLNQTSLCEWRTGFVREQEYQAFVYGFFDCLRQRSTMVVNMPETYTHHDTKAQFYERLRRAGCPVPQTLSTNVPGQASRFVKEHGRAVLKPSIGVGSTRIMHDTDLERLDEVRMCPVMLQEFIDGPTLRVHMVGGSVVLALEIEAEGIDSRTGHQTFTYTRISEEAEKALATAMKILGLHFAAWDVIRAPDGRYYLLDCNPGAYLMWIGEKYVRVVFDELARYMLTFANTGSMDEARKAVRVWQE